MSFLAAFSGVDMSGKTTQVDLLERWLAAQGVRVARFWYRPGYSDALDRFRAWVRSRIPGLLPGAGRSEARSRAFRRPVVRRAWMAMAALDSLLHFAVAVRSALVRNDVVLCDRYVEDAAIDLQLAFPEVAGAFWRRLFRAAAPRPRLAALLVLPWEEVLGRLASKTEPFAEPIPERRRRFEAYQILTRHPGVTVVDARRPANEIQEDLRVRLTGRGR